VAGSWQIETGMEEIFSDLESIRWSELSHALGMATDTPILLRGLISDFREERLDALYRLMETVWHQGTIYEATSFVVPFLARMLLSESTPDRDMIALLFASIADGSSYLEIHASPATNSAENWQNLLSKEGKDFSEQVVLEREWVKATRDAVAPHLELLYEFIVHEEPELRLAVASALGSYPSHATKSLEVLNAAISVEDELHVKQAMLKSGSRLQMDLEAN
jgi:hypothetical protein